jgi:PE family
VIADTFPAETSACIVNEFACEHPDAEASMEFFNVDPEPVAQAAQGLGRLGSELDEVSAVNSVPVTSVSAAAGDEVSIAVADQFGAAGVEFHALLGRAAQFHSGFVDLMSKSLAAYAGAEAANGTALASAANSAATAMGWLGDDLNGLANQIEGFAGFYVLNVGGTVEDVADAIGNAGSTLSSESAGDLGLLEPSLSSLSQLGLGDPLIGQDLGIVLGIEPNALAEQAAGGVLQGVGDGLFDVGSVIKTAGEAILPPGTVITSTS